MSNKKLFLNVLGLALATTISSANAQQAESSAAINDEAILFKIQDINPVKNSDGVITSCDFLAVFFNRTPNTLNGASLELSWQDKSIDELENFDKKNTNKSRNTRSIAPKISASIELSSIKSLKQVAVRSRLQSENCFVLMEEVSVQSRSCTMEMVSSSGGKATKQCGKMFLYVAPTDVAYYQEFSSESPAEEAKKALNAREKVREEINASYNETVSEFTKASKLISEIK
ncbi:MAG: hypothetical protein PHE89_06010 [Alphaproteobacteria bacterium]|nr:hypothetical protein [Alphaproteobacteria bacterium]